MNCNQGDKISTSGSRFRMLRSVVECRTNPVPGGIADPNAVCYRPTVFRWSDEDGVAHRFDGPDLDAGSGNNARVGGARLGDIDGDGRTDVVWFRRDDPACPSGNRLRVGYGDRVEVGGQSKATLVTPDIATFCTSLNAGNGELNTGFGLLDFDGDGRDDLAIADNNGIAGAKWHIYRSLGRPTVSSGNAFDTSTDLMNVAISTADDSQDQAQFGDFNGDGLLDILYPTGSNGLAIRYLQRNATQTAFEFGAEYALNFTLADCSGFSCNLEIFNQPTAGFGVASDFSGDGRSDLVLRVIRSNSAVPGQTTVTYISGENLAIQRPDLALAFESQRFHAVALGARDDVGRIQVASQYGNTLHVRNDIGVQDPRDFQFADLNGDGLADLFYYYPIQGDDDYRFALNRGNGFDGPNGSVVTGAVQNIPNKEKLRLADVNGDGRADVLYPSGDSAPCAGTIAADHAYRSRSWSMRFGATTNGRIDDPDQGANPQNGATCLAGNGAKAGSLTDSEYYFADFDGDGATDFLRLRDRIGTVSVGGVTQSDPEIALSRANAASRFKARDAIVRITNGNGAVTNITYQPLTNKAIYRRATNSRNLKIWGRGSPVHDLLNAQYVVSKVSSSSPTRANPAGLAEIWYQYGNGRAQAGGRGSLGFSVISTFDANVIDGGYTVTESNFRQDFPFTGAILSTLKFVATGSTPTRGSTALDLCASNPEASAQDCFYDPSDSGDAAFPWPPGSLIRVSASSWACKGVSGAEACALPEFSDVCPDTGLGTSPQAIALFGSAPEHRPDGALQFSATALTTQQPFFPYVVRSLDIDFDPVVGSVTRNQCGLYQYSDGFGNLTSVNLHTFKDGTGQAASLVARKETTSTYINDVANWRLGRARTSLVNDIRDGTTLSRISDFDYEVDRPAVPGDAGYTSATDTGLLKGERVQKDISSDQDLRTLYDLDEFGNRIASYQCSRLKFDGTVMSDAECRNKALVKHRPVATLGPATAVHRYAGTTYSSNGRYPTSVSAPYYSSSTTNNVVDVVSQAIAARDEFGNVTLATNANQLSTIARFGSLGRAYYTSDSTGASTTSTFRWCRNTTNTTADGNNVGCPSNAAFRQKTSTAGAPTVYSFFDELGRVILTTTEGFKTATGVNWRATCTAYDSHGRSVFTSTPFFLAASYGNAAEPTFTAGANPCAISQGIVGTTSIFDKVGRVRQVQAADGSSSSITFDKLTTITTDSRGLETKETKNSLGEVISIVQANAATGLVGTPADPQILTVTQQYDSQGNLRYVRRNAGQGEIVTEAQYDFLGRKVAVLDPDRGYSSYLYNAAGELIRTVNARGDRIEQSLDALGRVWRRRAGPNASFDIPSDRIFAHSFEDGSGSTSALLVVDEWEYDTAPNGIGALKFERRTFTDQPTVTAFYRQHNYDAIGRPSNQQTSFDALTYTTATTYDGFGRPQTQTDASTGVTSTFYTARGYLDYQQYSVTAVGTAGRFYEVLDMDAWGHITSERRNGSTNPISTTMSYDPSRGWIDTVVTGTLQNWNFDFDTNGNLFRRDRGAGALVETLTYDKLNRLSNVARSGTATTAGSTAVGYDRIGNICTKGALTYTYGGADGCNGLGSGAGPHAVTQAGAVSYFYDGNGNQIRADSSNDADDRTSDHDALEQVVYLTRGPLAAPTAEAEFLYAPDGGRYRRKDISAGLTKITRYVGNVEVIIANGITTTKRYLAGGAIVTTYSNQPSVVEDRYALPDHLGSVDVVVNDLAQVVESTSFDAWGARRSAANWTSAGTALATTTHGFTGHEHVDSIGLIHMNGRVYDPGIGRFLEADTLIDSGVQGLNRYSYVLNNPLSATDPTGHLSTHEWGQVFTSAILIMGTGGLGAAAAEMTMAEGFVFAGANGFMAGAIQSQSLKGGAWGAFSAIAFHGIGSYFESAQWAHNGSPVFGTNLDAGGYAAKVLAHGVMGGVVQHLQGGSYGSGFAAAGVTQAFGGAIGAIDPANPTFGATLRIVTAGLVGGTVSDMTGGKFANGAVTSAFARAFNDERGNSNHRYRTQVELRYTEAYMDYSHAFVVVIDARGYEWGIRAGPENKLGGVYGGKWGPIDVSAGPRNSIGDFRGPVYARQTVLFTNRSPKSIIGSLLRFGQSVDAAQIPYSPKKLNSNSFAFDAVQSLGVPRPSPPIGLDAIGWDNTLGMFDDKH